jgi:putative PIN family toxin of toxin-antitoxin system
VRIVLDTNILARAHQRALGPARRLLVQILTGPHALILSPYVLSELERVLTYPRLLKPAGLTAADIGDYLEYLARASTLVDPLPVPPDLIRDRADEPVLGTALAAQAHVICTLDADFFTEKVRRFCEAKGIKVLTDIELLHSLGVTS